ncbi:DUF433 domain-containing protein [Thermus aquaticus]|uniref:DUF433 domain-containing protein n=1 Tax=Thermus aquaticus TaxID=271 RepID=UPI00200E487F|nr:DUF433 domain-containing protein [Thermus aquaticus]
MDQGDLLARISVDPEVNHGQPTVRGLRYPVKVLLELLASGMTPEEILADYPDLESEDLQAVLLYAARLAEGGATTPCTPASFPGATPRRTRRYAPSPCGNGGWWSPRTGTSSKTCSSERSPTSSC